MQALRALGWDPRPVTASPRRRWPPSSASCPPTSGCSAGCSRCWPRTACCAADGRLGESWTVQRLRTSPARRGARGARRQLGARPSSRCSIAAAAPGRRAARRRDPLQLLFPRATSSRWSGSTRSGPVARVFNTLVRARSRRPSPALPPGRRLRVLEIGAGTGGHHGRRCSPRCRQRAPSTSFTDISPLFTGPGRPSRFARPCRSLACRSLDIERDPGGAGLRDGAASTSSSPPTCCTPRADLRRTLGHVRAAARPGRRAGAARGHGAYRWVDLTFGLTEGWWRFADADAAPVLSAARTATAGRRCSTTRASSTPHAVPGAHRRRRALSSQALSSRAPPRLDRRAGDWLVLADRGGVGRRVAELRPRARRALLVVAPRRRRPGGEDEWVLRPDHPRASMRWRVRRAARARRLSRCSTLGARRRRTGSLESLQAAQVLGAGACSHLGPGARCLAGRRAHALWVVTRGAQPATKPGARGRAAAGAGVGLGPRHGARASGALGRADRPRSRRSLTAGGGASLGELAATRRRGPGGAARRWPRCVARLRAPRAARPARCRRCARDATYLVTGGLGGLGLKVAEWLAEPRAPGISSSSAGRADRSGGRARPETAAAPGRAVRAVEALGRDGHRRRRPTWRTRAAMAALLATFGATMPPLRGVVHAAAALDATAVRELRSRTRSSAMLAPRCSAPGCSTSDARPGARLLRAVLVHHRAARGAPASRHYAAANQFLDASPTTAARRGLPALSVNWGTWDEMRVASDGGPPAGSPRPGCARWPSAAALELLGAALGGDAVQPVVAAIDWTVLKPLYEARRAGPSSRTWDRRPAAGRAARAGGDLRRASGGRRRRSAPRHRRCSGCARRSRRCSRLPLAEVDAEHGLFDMGLDSLMALELAAASRPAWARSLPSTLAFNYPTAVALADFLDTDDVDARGRRQPPAPVARRARPRAADADDLSEDELAALLGAQARAPGDERRDRSRPTAARSCARRCARVDEMQAKLDAAERAAHRADRHRRDGLPLPGRRQRPRGVLAAAARRRATRSREVPADRWDAEAYCDSTRARRRRCPRCYGGFLDGIDQLRPAVLRHLAARGGHAWIRSSGCCSR